MDTIIESVYSKEDSVIVMRSFQRLKRAYKGKLTPQKEAMVTKAFHVASTAHQDDRRKSGEPYITHPIEVAHIVCKEMGMGATTITCALLHDTVEDTDVTLEYLTEEFSEKVSRIIDGLTKISEVVDLTSGSIQAENFRKILLTISEDIRVIIIKLADRLHNMRTLGSMRREKQLKIASETLFLYAPLAHRFGFYNIKSELEDLCLQYMEPVIFEDIKQKLAETKASRQRYIADFTKPIKKALTNAGLKYTIKGRPKHIYSIWNKMKNKKVTFEEMYDLFAIRILLDSKPENEKSDCWRAYSMVTDFYKPNPDRLKDFISNPKTNGYESLHTTVMGPRGRWVEVQIRTERMDEIAEQGLAAHWKYKEGGNNNEGALDTWIKHVRELLQNPESNAIEFINNFKSELFDEEIYIFTPNGDVKMLPKGATALDFAFAIHTQVGSQCMGAKVNHKLVPISYELKNGDQVEIITSKKQKPNDDWLKIVKTTRAKSKIKSSLKEAKKLIADDGKEILERKLKALKLPPGGHENIHEIANYFGYKTTLDLHFAIAQKQIDLAQLKEFTSNGSKIIPPVRESNIESKQLKFKDNKVNQTASKESDLIIMGADSADLEYDFAKCCNPIPGDNVFGFITIGKGIKIHRTNCPNAVQLMSKYGYRVVKVNWTSKKEIAFLSGLQIRGFDGKGLINKITGIISTDMNLNMQSLNISSEDGVFEGTIKIYVNDTKELEKLSRNIKQMDGIIKVYRI